MGESEEPGYRLYSYILFAVKPSYGTIEQHRALIAAYIQTLDEVGETKQAQRQ